MNEHTAIVSGGSLSGLMVALVLKDIGYSVIVLERSLVVQSQGAGIVLGKWSTAFFDLFDKTNTVVGVPALKRQFFNKDGSVMLEEPINLRMTTWDKLYYTLRANYDGHIEKGYINNMDAAAQKCDRAQYFMGKNVLSHDYDPHSRKVSVTFQDRDGQRHVIQADLFICAEGASSSSREAYFPNLPRTYSGYLAFRGLVPEKDLTPETAGQLVNALSFIHAKDSQFLSVPGLNGSTIPGERHLNFVWYNTYPEGPHLEKVMTDKEHKRRPFSVPSGHMPESVLSEEIHPRAYAKLSPQCREVVLKTQHPFVQVVTDVISPSAVFHNGHVVLVGDALSGARPHTTASTNQAADHALRLHAIFSKNPSGLDTLKELWEPRSLEYSRHLYDIGKAIGDLSQFGDHPMSVEREAPGILEEWLKVGEPK